MDTEKIISKIIANDDYFDTSTNPWIPNQINHQLDHKLDLGTKQIYEIIRLLPILEKKKFTKDK